MTTTFPKSLDSFTDKVNNVDIVYAADVNNLQDAVAALERAGGGLGPYYTPVDVFDSFSGYTWATNLHFDGTPASVSLTNPTGALTLYNDNGAEEFFAYQTATSATEYCTVRVGLGGGGSYIGARIDDGGAGAENAFELRLTWSATAPFYRLQWRAVTAGTPTTGYYADLIPPGMYVLQIARNVAGTWNGYGYITKDAPFPGFIGATLASATWVPARKGFTFGISANSTQTGSIHWLK